MISVLVGDPHKGQVVDLQAKLDSPQSFSKQVSHGGWVTSPESEGWIRPVTHHASRWVSACINGWVGGCKQTSKRVRDAGGRSG